MKNNRFGQASVLNSSDFAKLRSKFRKSEHRLFFDIARWTGERWGAIRQLKVSDVYDDRGKPLESITFRAGTRKAAPDGSRKTRQVPVHPALRDALTAYKVDRTRTYLFEGSEPGEPISFSAVDKFFRRAVERAGLQSKGASTHSTRRSFITELSRKGVDVRTIQGLTGHSDVRVLMRYVEQSPDRLRNAIEML